ncbi:hypothetical protein DY000_02008247 [Brassica cretica]|uniref:CCHC-type domain-containing protein n=1 Tax=Brassica cretica TaxID=69181 RepID=A0ABQ7BUN3_BRACR|nr:hypothetical protein DY000_02008247 [Brassica cretica]
MVVTPVGNMDTCKDTVMLWKARLSQGRLENIVSSLNHGCYSCGRVGHTHRFCYEQINNIKKAGSENKCYVEPKSYCKVWIAKSECIPNVRGLTMFKSLCATKISLRG